MPKITPLKRDKFEAFLIMIGCTLKRTKGDHLVYTKIGFSRPVIIPKDSRVEIFIIFSNIRTAKISRERYLELLKNI